MKVDIKLGPDGHQCEIIDRETNQRIPATKLELLLEPNMVPMLKLDVEADDITVTGENVNTEIGKLTMLHVEGWAKKNGFRLVPDDNLDMELGRIRDPD